MPMHERDGVGDSRPLRPHSGDEIRVADGHKRTLRDQVQRTHLGCRNSWRATLRSGGCDLGRREDAGVGSLGGGSCCGGCGGVRREEGVDRRRGLQPMPRMPFRAYLASGRCAPGLEQRAAPRASSLGR
jgi:hypothetical protein